MERAMKIPPSRLKATQRRNRASTDNLVGNSYHRFSLPTTPQGCVGQFSSVVNVGLYFPSCQPVDKVSLPFISSLL